MLPIISAQQTRELDKYTIINEPIASIDLMERAALACSKWFMTKFNRSFPVYIFAGTGNNGGDAIAIARILHKYGYVVHLYVIFGKFSVDNEINQQRFKLCCNAQLEYIYSTNEFPNFEPKAIIVDGIFGSGLSKPISGLYSDLIDLLNKADAIRVAIDIPSGLMDTDNPFLQNSDQILRNMCFMAHFTLAIETPFLSMLLPENFMFTGYWTALSIQLDQIFLQQLETPYFLLQETDIASKLKIRKKFDHKGTFGHLFLAAGRKGSLGAALLAAKAALKAGAGLVTAHVPSNAMTVFQTALPEAMIHLDLNDDIITDFSANINYTAVAIGPGIGLHIKTKMALVSFLQQNDKPLVIDADGLNLLAEIPEFFALLSENTILTPHPKEFDRLFGQHSNTMGRIKTQQEISKKLSIIIVLKGAHTSISDSFGNVFFNVTGNPSMAKGGSGDVLTGIIGAFLAKSYPALDSARLAVYLHGLAGDFALKKHSSESVLASDIIHGISAAFRYFNL